MKCKQIEIMRATANRNITISKGARIVKGQEVKVYRHISMTSVPLCEVVLSDESSFVTPQSLVNRFFTTIK